jgi:RNA-directed DNA polymerase
VQFSTGTPGGGGVNRILSSGRMAQEANASGKARGYADVSTIVWKVEVQVGAQAMDTVTQQPMDGWNTIAWKKVERTVLKLQKRLYRAQGHGNVSRVRSLQRLLRHSRSAKLWAVRRVTQDNQGKKTAGVDGKKSLTPAQRLALVTTLRLPQKPHPVRRVWIPKPATDEKRPLGLPALEDKLLQCAGARILGSIFAADFLPYS